MAKNDLKLFAGGSSANVMSQAEYEALASLVNGFATGVAQSKQLNKVWRQASFVAAMIGLFTGEKSGEDVLDDGDVDGFEAKFARAMQAFIANQTAIGSFWQPVISMTVANPPASPAIGDAYIIPTAATGAWAGKSQNVAVWSGTAWRIFVAKDGHGVSLPDGRVYERVGGSYVEKLALDVQSGKWTYATAGGSANALSITLNPAPSSWDSLIGAVLRVKIQSANTGAATLAISGISGTKDIVRGNGSATQPNDLVLGQIIELVYDGAKVQMISTGRASGGGAASSGVTSYTAGSYTYTVPAGVYRIECEVWGGGGGGGYAFPSTNAGTGGGGGGYSRGVFDVIPGQQIPVLAGAGGAGGTSSVTAQYGGTSSVGSLISATGGGPGAWENGGSSGPNNNFGGVGSGGQFNWSGIAGGGQFVIDTSRIGGWGAPAFCGTWSGFNVADPGRLPGCGGGGGTAFNSRNSGGPGASGLVIIKTL